MHAVMSRATTLFLMLPYSELHARGPACVGMLSAWAEGAME